MSDSIISVDNLGKKYLLRHQAQRQRYATLRETVIEKVRSCFVRTGRRSVRETIEYFWALNDVAFEVKRGEVVGVIGRNGAGKSTLLKILSRITEPTTGEVWLRGRVASLLEVGTGFHPELTGRENIFLNGAILGMARQEILRKFDEIVAFAEVEAFLDTPVKRYSSGMYVRLAFAVAAHLEPEILIVDEVLAVGDAEFQKKCLGKMNDVAKGGRTVLFVSHNMGAVQALCSRGLLLTGGRLVMDGPVRSVCERYLQGSARGLAGVVTWSADSNARMCFTELAVLNEKNQPVGRLGIEEKIRVRVSYQVGSPLTGATICLRVRRNGILLFNSFDSDETPAWLGMRSPGKYEAIIELPRYMLGAGQYTLSIGAGIPRTESIVGELMDVLAFELHEETQDVWIKGYAAERGALLIAPIKWSVERLP